jgi:transposase
MKKSTEGTLGKKSRRQYTKEFKLEALRLCQEPGMGPSRVAADLGINRSMLSSWAKQLKDAPKDAFRGHGTRTELEGENAALKRRIRVLEQERDILKKAATWFAKESE